LRRNLVAPASCRHRPSHSLKIDFKFTMFRPAYFHAGAFNQLYNVRSSLRGHQNNAPRTAHESSVVDQVVERHPNGTRATLPFASTGNPCWHIFRKSENLFHQRSSGSTVLGPSDPKCQRFTGRRSERPEDQRTKIVGHRAVRSRPRFYIHTPQSPELL
jgi:hypothetical protein